MRPSAYAQLQINNERLSSYPYRRWAWGSSWTCHPHCSSTPLAAPPAACSRLHISDFGQHRLISDPACCKITPGPVGSAAEVQTRGDYYDMARGLYKEGTLKESLGVKFQEGIIIWHIGTDVFLAKSKTAKTKEAAERVEAIKVLSNYMMFLLVDRPYMLPGQPQKWLYLRTCEKLVNMRVANPKYMLRRHNNMIKDLFRVHDSPAGFGCSRAAERDELANNLYDEYESSELSYVAPRLTHVARLAKELLEQERDGTSGTLKLILEVWMDILVYAGNKCSRNSHAEKLNSGGEMTTILWLMAEHLYQASL
uniref:Uncharacterized protein n=1 Tax=Avena sativa TaxID=4498 RepID=A0ACD5YZK0_AVESA